MSNCCKCKLLEISRLLSHADLHTIELSRKFIKSRIYYVILVEQFLCKLSGMLQNTLCYIKIYKD